MSDAMEHIDWAIGYARRVADPQDAVFVFPTAISIRAALGETDAVEGLLTELVQTPGIGDEPDYGLRLPEMVRVAIATGLSELANSLRRTCGTITPMHRLGVRGSDALLTELQGDFEGATEIFLDVSERWESFGVVWEQAHAFLGAGRCLAALGRPNARATFLAAREIFERLGAGPSIVETDAWLARAATSAS